MKKFMIFYMADPAALRDNDAELHPGDAEEGDGGVDALDDRTQGVHVDRRAPLGKTRRVDAKGAKDARNGIGGYSVVQADFHDAAAKMFSKDHPHLQMPGAWVEIVEIMPMPGM